MVTTLAVEQVDTRQAGGLAVEGHGLVAPGALAECEDEGVGDLTTVALGQFQCGHDGVVLLDDQAR